MLKSTFIHVPGIGEGLERRIWNSGIKTWSDFFHNGHTIGLSSNRQETILKELRVSRKKLSDGDFSYFKQSLPSQEYWRMYPEFSKHTAFVDIETTGLGYEDDITMIGLYDGRKTNTYVRGQDLEEFGKDIQKYKVLVTFNGTCFDLPFIRSAFPDLPLDQVHIDLRWVLYKIGLRGGLKAIEQSLGVCRSEEIRGMTGWDAVHLWHRYLKGDQQSLDLIIKYNREDIVNLKKIIELTYPQLVKNTFNPPF